MVGRTSIMAIIGGTFAKLGGGKFANGAMSAAFVHLFNAEAAKVVMDNYTKAKLKEIQNVLKSGKILQKVIPVGQFALLFDKPSQFIYNNINTDWNQVAQAISVLPGMVRSRIINICDYSILYYQSGSTVNYKLETFWRDMKNVYEQK